MLKVFFSCSLAVETCAVAAYFYFTSSFYSSKHPQWMAGVGPLLTALLITAALVVWWIVYFLLTRDFGRLWMPLVVLSPFVIPLVQTAVRSSQEIKHHRDWLLQASERSYRSDVMGVTFQYVSEDEYFGPLVISENADGLLMTSGSQGDLLKLISVKGDGELIDRIKAVYGGEFPACRFYLLGEAASGLGFSPSMRVVGFSDSQDGACPRLGPNSASAGRDFFFELADDPKKTFFVSLSASSFPSARPTEQSPFPLKWFGTIELNAASK